MAPKFALFTKGSKLPINKGFKNMLELHYSLVLNPRIFTGFMLAVIPDSFSPTNEHLPRYGRFSSLQIDNIFLIFFLENRILHFMKIVSFAYNLHEVSNPIF